MASSTEQAQGAGIADRPRRRPAKPICTAVAAEVRRVVDLTPHLVRITVGAEEFTELSFLGSDHYLRLLLPRPGQREPALPASEAWWTEMQAMPAAVRPILRNYTVRAVRPDRAELDIDFVRHGDVGPGSRFAGAARAGDRIGVIDQGVLHEIDHRAQDYLVIGDETALPAAAGVLADLGTGVRAQALLEIPSAGDTIDLPSAATVDVRFLVRSDPQARPGSVIVAALRQLRRPVAAPAAWIAGESRMATAARRHLVTSLGLPKSAICFHGYFRHGRVQYDD